jgi:hypothetical protein
MSDRQGTFGSDWEGFEDRRVAAFFAFHKANPHVYALFVRFALQAAARRNNFSARCVFHRIRWATQVESTGDDFKINNNWSPFYVRLFEIDHPEQKGFFRKRAAAADTADL